MPAKDAEAVADLRRAGAIVYGKTNVPEGAGDHQTYNKIFGKTSNPWHLSRTPGGSSGGAAVAVATGMTSLEIGSDIGGSIRVPAHFCGIFGHNPSHGLVPLGGHVPPPPGTLSELVMAVAGPMARSAYDLELALEVLAMPSALDRKGRTWHLPGPRREKLSDFRVALWADDKGPAVDPAYLHTIHAFADDLRRLGVAIVDIRPPIDVDECIDVYAAILFGMWSASLPEQIYNVYAASAADVKVSDRSWAARIGRGSTQRVREWNQIIEKRERIRQIWENFFSEFDILLCPVVATLAFEHDPSGVDHTAQLRRNVRVGNRQIPYLDLLIWPGLITLPKLPATVLPTGRFVDGLPAGVQIVSAYLEDRTTLRFAQLVEDATGGFLAPPTELYMP
jgi:amidase